MRTCQALAPDPSLRRIHVDVMFGLSGFYDACIASGSRCVCLRIVARVLHVYTFLDMGEVPRK